MKKRPFYHFPLLACGFAMAMTACSSDDLPESVPPPIPPGDDGIGVTVPEGGLSVARCKVLTIKPEVSGSTNYSIVWTANGSTPICADSLNFIALNAGTYKVIMTATANGKEPVVQDITVNVSNADYSAYITSVADYRPAPGQFVNELPEYTDGDTQSDMNRKALEAIGNNTRGMITLGSYGGYVVCGFDHTIVNVAGQKDFKVLGNAFYADANPNPDASENGGSNEPGIVMVAYDRNKNGRPDDDEWYELAGSEYHKPTTLKNYSITYYKPEEGHLPVAPPQGEESWNSDAEYILWTDNKGGEGYVYKNIYHRQDYYPRWIDDETMTFAGTLLPQNARDESGTGHYWVLYSYPWGYADNRLNTEDASDFDIDWAVDKNGNKVHLPGVDFVKIYTGVNQYCGWLGETSTEVMGINDLHLTK